MLTLVLLLPLYGLIGYGHWSGNQKSVQARMDATRQHVEIAHGLLAWAYQQQESGVLTLQQAQAAAREAIASLRYDGVEYFWINDLQPRMIMHLIKPELDGQPVGDITDPNGVALFREFARTASEQGSGFVAYQWPRPGSTQPVDKLSFVQAFEPWGWVIGSGIYVDDLARAQQQQLQVLLLVAVLTFMVGGYCFLSYYRAMQSSLQEASFHLRRITEGKLDMPIEASGRDEASQLLQHLHEMQEFLRRIVQQIRGTSKDIQRSISEIASGAGDLSDRTSQTSDSLVASAASMEEITATVTETTHNTEEASKKARLNAEVAATGGNSMREVVNTMQAIQTSSSRIGEIIGTIDGIAFQTNLLALNAAVEAARAGEAGRGFAVVASEVRVLAQRSAEAAQEIKQLVGSTVQQVNEGSTVVQRACAIIEEIVESSHQVDQILDDVSNAAREQSSGIGQIGKSVADLDRVTEQNGALVCETVGAVAAAKGLASTLIFEVERFHLPEAARRSNNPDH